MSIRIEQWAVIRCPSGNPYQAPEQATKRLVGKVFGHPNHTDGSGVTTSSLVSFDLKARCAQTQNTEYVLGEPDRYYREQNDALFVEAGFPSITPPGPAAIQAPKEYQPFA